MENLEKRLASIEKTNDEINEKLTGISNRIDKLNRILDEREQASKTLVQPDVIGSCRFYEQDNTTAMNCKHCGKSKWLHGSGNLL
jgi:uncharacterized coiled-coil protein SlyX